MTVYSYQCESCKHFFDKLYPGNIDEQVQCPRCGSSQVKIQPLKSLAGYINSLLSDDNRSGQ